MYAMATQEYTPLFAVYIYNNNLKIVYAVLWTFLPIKKTIVYAPVSSRLFADFI